MGLQGGQSPNLIFSGLLGNHCNTHDDLAYKQLFGSACLGGEVINVSIDAEFFGSIPQTAQSATLILEPNAAANPNNVLARYKICGGAPTPVDGLPLFAYAIIEVANPVNLNAFQIISADGLDHTLRVVYNQKSGSIISIGQRGAPSSTPGLTDAQLRANPVPVATAIQTAAGNISALNANLGTGVATANSAVEINLQGDNMLGIQVTGVYNHTLLVQVTFDGVNWVNVNNANAIYNVSSGTYIGTIATITGAFLVDVTAALRARVTCSAYTSGVSTITLRSVENSTQNFNSPPTPSGLANIGNVGIQAGQTVTLQPLGTIGVNSHHRRLSTADTNLVNVKSSVGVIASLEIVNDTPNRVYLKLYNKATAPVIATDAALILKTIMVLPSSTLIVPVPAVGWRFVNGISYAMTGAIADTNTGPTEIGVMVNMSFT